MKYPKHLPFPLAIASKPLGLLLSFDGWKSGADVRTLAGNALRLHFVMRGADVYALRFKL